MGQNDCNSIQIVNHIASVICDKLQNNIDLRILGLAEVIKLNITPNKYILRYLVDWSQSIELVIPDYYKRIHIIVYLNKESIKVYIMGYEHQSILIYTLNVSDITGNTSTIIVNKLNEWFIEKLPYMDTL